MKSILSVFVVLFFTGPVAAETWYVEADGSTEYSTIQSAVNVAASGDTVRVGPGLYDDFFTWNESYPEELVVVHVTQAELTLIGAGLDETVLGPSVPWNVSQDDIRGVLAGRAFANERLTIESICIQNVYQGILFEGGGKLRVANSSLQGNSRDLFVYTPTTTSGDEVIIEACEFRLPSEASSPTHIKFYNQDLVLVTDSHFVLRETGISKHVSCSGREIIVENCEFLEGEVGIATLADETFVRNCLFEGQALWGLRAYNAGKIRIEDSKFENQYCALYNYDYWGEIEWKVQRTIFENVTDSTFRYRSLGPGFFRNCILAKGEQFVVRSYKVNGSSEKTHFDMTNNWWGTANPDSIQAWIWDASDEPELGHTIDWDPYKSEPVATEKKSLGGLRAMYR